MKQKIHQLFFVLRFGFTFKFISAIRKFWFKMQGMKIGQNTLLPSLYVSWPHQIQIGNDCKLEHGINFKFDGIWMPGPSIKIADRVFIGNGCEFNIKKGIYIGDDSLIASGCKFIDHDHGVSKSKLTRLQQETEKQIFIDKNVWIGCNAIILKGITIGEGAVIAAGSVVNGDVLPHTIVAGIPAKFIKQII